MFVTIKSNYCNSDKFCHFCTDTWTGLKQHRERRLTEWCTCIRGTAHCNIGLIFPSTCQEYQSKNFHSKLRTTKITCLSTRFRRRRKKTVDFKLDAGISYYCAKLVCAYSSRTKQQIRKQPLPVVHIVQALYSHSTVWRFRHKDARFIPGRCPSSEICGTDFTSKKRPCAERRLIAVKEYW